MSQRSFRFKGSTVQYWEFHPGKPHTIVMIHGFRGTHHGLQSIIDALPEFHIIVPDLPGFGASTPMDDAHTIASYVAFVKSLLAKLQVTQPILLGHSFGSIVASHFAAEYPGAISSLVLINPISTPALRGPKRLLTNIAVFYYWLGKSLPERAGRALLANRLIVLAASRAMAKTRDKKLRAHIHNQHLTYFSTFQNRNVLDESFRASVSHTVTDVAERITVPTLLIAGDKDDIAPLKGQHALMARLQDGTLDVIQGVGHLVHYETPVQAARAIEKFVAERDGAS